jgi:hypothetical protein
MLTIFLFWLVKVGVKITHCGYLVSRGGSQVFNKRGTFRMNENIKENGHISMHPPAGSNTTPANTTTNRYLT